MDITLLAQYLAPSREQPPFFAEKAPLAGMKTQGVWLVHFGSFPVFHFLRLRNGSQQTPQFQFVLFNQMS